jgi:hypothetical protein
MRSLENLIENWRNELSAQPSFNQENLDELEDHLRMSLETMQKSGLSEEEAFLIASRRMGSTQNLDSEYGKINTVERWTRYMRWMVTGILAFQAFTMIWKFAARLVSGYWLVTSQSIVSTGIVFVVLSILLPVALWTGIKAVTSENSKLTAVIPSIRSRPGLWTSLLVSVFVLIPVGGILFTSITASQLTPQTYGNFSALVSGIDLISGTLLPILGIILLKWLSSDRKRRQAAV